MTSCFPLLSLTLSLNPHLNYIECVTHVFIWKVERKEMQMMFIWDDDDELKKLSMRFVVRLRNFLVCHNFKTGRKKLNCLFDKCLLWVEAMPGTSAFIFLQWNFLSRHSLKLNFVVAYSVMKRTDFYLQNNKFTHQRHKTLNYIFQRTWRWVNVCYLFISLNLSR